jgi:hypothetical protein
MGSRSRAIEEAFKSSHASALHWRTYRTTPRKRSGAGNHYHFADYMNNAEDGSVPFVILYKPDL